MEHCTLRRLWIRLPLQKKKSHNTKSKIEKNLVNKKYVHLYLENKEINSYRGYKSFVVA